MTTITVESAEPTPMLHRRRTNSPPLVRCVATAVVMFIAAVVGLTTPRASTAQSVHPPASRPLTLADVLDSALTRHPLARAAAARIDAARGARTTARAFGNPVLSYDVENAPFPGGSPVTGMDRETMTTATLPLASLVQRLPGARRADAVVRAAEADARLARQELALDASRAFFRTALAQVGADAARDLTSWLDSVVAYNKTRVEEGVAAEADLLRAELERDRAAAAATLQEAELARARAELGSYLGDVSTSRSDLVVTIDDAPFAFPAITDVAGAAQAASAASVRDNASRVAISRRPDVRAAQERLTAAGSGLATERTMIVREIGATFGAKRAAGQTSMVAGVSLPLPIFDPNRGEIARASAERDAAAFELAARERTASAELSGAYDAARLLTERAALLAQGANGRPPLLARADEGRRIALGAYREGAVSLLQVIDAARAWGEARLAFYQTLYAQHESVAALLVARGDDLLTELPPLASGARATPSR
jgi:cobalt-zinc-cadmium efflux system outer membrane protein